MVNLFDIEDKETNKIKVIGEGAYGCVHKPSLKCSKTKEQMKYRNKITEHPSLFLFLLTLSFLWVTSIIFTF